MFRIYQYDQEIVIYNEIKIALFWKQKVEETIPKEIAQLEKKFDQVTQKINESNAAIALSDEKLKSIKQYYCINQRPNSDA